MKNGELPNGRKMRELAEMIAAKIPGLGFQILVFTFGEEQRQANYISNAERKVMIEALEEFINVIKSGGDWETPDSN